LFFAAFNFLVGIVNILFMPMLLSVTTPDILGMVISVGGIGMLIGTLVIGIWGGPKKRIWGVLGFFLGSGVFILLAGVRPWVPLFMVASFGFFFCQPIVGACAQTIFQTKVAHDVQGRFFALSGMVTGAATPLASIVTGPLADRVFEPLLAKGGALSASVGAWIGVGQGRGIGLMFILTGIGAILLAVGGIAYPHLRRLEDELPDVTPDHAPMETENVAPDAYPV
jgi:MFS transporter, DHA3 family, macrolide efflux protein